MRRLIGAMAVLLRAIPAQAQEECVGIENDIARLQCFDAAFADVVAAEPSPRAPEEVYASLAKLVASVSTTRHGHPVVVSSAFDRGLCLLVLTYTASNNDADSAYLQKAISVEMGKVATISQGFGGVRFDMDRGERAAVMHSSFYNPAIRFDVPKLQQLADQNASFLITFGPAVEGQNISKEPSASIAAITDDSMVDTAKILSELEALAASCRSG